MIITQQDRDNYSKLCSLYQDLFQALGRIKKIVNDDQVYTILYQAAKRLVGRKDMLWLDNDGQVVQKENAYIKLSFAGFMRRERWGRTWKRIQEYEMWNYLFRSTFIEGLESHPTTRNPTAFKDLISILKDGSNLKEVKNKGLDVSTKLKLPKVITVQQGLATDEIHAKMVEGFQVCDLELISSVNWNASIKLKCITPGGEVCIIDDLVRQETYLRFSEAEILEPIYTVLKEAKSFVDEQYELLMQPQREFNQKYGQYLVAKEL